MEWLIFVPWKISGYNRCSFPCRISRGSFRAIHICRTLKNIDFAMALVFPDDFDVSGIFPTIGWKSVNNTRLVQCVQRGEVANLVVQIIPAEHFGEASFDENAAWPDAGHYNLMRSLRCLITDLFLPMCPASHRGPGGHCGH